MCALILYMIQPTQLCCSLCAVSSMFLCAAMSSKSDNFVKFPQDYIYACILCAWQYIYTDICVYNSFQKYLYALIHTCMYAYMYVFVYVTYDTADALCSRPWIASGTHFAHMKNKSWHTDELRHVTNLNEACHTYESCRSRSLCLSRTHPLSLSVSFSFSFSHSCRTYEG